MGERHHHWHEDESRKEPRVHRDMLVRKTDFREILSLIWRDILGRERDWRERDTITGMRMGRLKIPGCWIIRKLSSLITLPPNSYGLQAMNKREGKSVNYPPLYQKYQQVYTISLLQSYRL